MMKSKKVIVRRQGYSRVMAIPAEMCDLVGIQDGTVLNVEQRENGIMLIPLEVTPK